MSIAAGSRPTDSSRSSHIEQERPGGAQVLGGADLIVLIRVKPVEQRFDGGIDQLEGQADEHQDSTRHYPAARRLRRPERDQARNGQGYMHAYRTFAAPALGQALKTAAGAQVDRPRRLRERHHALPQGR